MPFLLPSQRCHSTEGKFGQICLLDANNNNNNKNHFTEENQGELVRHLHGDSDDRDLTATAEIPSGMETDVAGLAWGCKKKCRNEDAFYCNAAAAVHPVAKRILQQLLLNPIPIAV